MNAQTASDVISPVPLNDFAISPPTGVAIEQVAAYPHLDVSSLDDAAIRVALRAQDSPSLRRTALASDDCFVLAEEVPLLRGHVRADLVRVTARSMHVLEIKSDRDNRGRLAEQARVYSQVADEVTLFVGRRHVVWALGAVPEWWEVVQVSRSANGTVEFAPISPRRRNPKATRLDQLALLSRSALSASLSRSSVFSSSTDPLSTLRSLASACLTASEVRLALANQLATRMQTDHPACVRPAAAQSVCWTEQPSFL